MTAQVQAPEDELIMDRSAALGVLEELSLSAPLNAGIRDQAGTWLRSAPADATTTVNGIRVRFISDEDQLVVAFTYPPPR